MIRTLDSYFLVLGLILFLWPVRWHFTIALPMKSRLFSVLFFLVVSQQCVTSKLYRYLSPGSGWEESDWCTADVLRKLGRNNDLVRRQNAHETWIIWFWVHSASTGLQQYVRALLAVPDPTCFVSKIIHGNTSTAAVQDYTHSQEYSSNGPSIVPVCASAQYRQYVYIATTGTINSTLLPNRTLVNPICAKRCHRHY